MKKIFLTALIALFAVNTWSQEEEKPFLEKYKKIVTQIEAIDNKNFIPSHLDSLRHEYNKITENFDSIKRTLNSDEIQEYYTYRSRYQKKIALVKTARGFQSAKSWIKGVVNKDK